MSVRRFVLLPVLALVGALLSLGSPAHAIVYKDCSDFDTQRQAQTFFMNNSPSTDPHRLDSDGDGRACETLPCPCGTSTSGGDGSGTTGSTTVRERARVTRVVDGDTVKVRLSTGVLRTVRLIGIDTPEVYGGVECGGRKASRSLKRLLPEGTRVAMASDPTQARKDRYDRLLRYVTRVRDGQGMNWTQVHRGWARVYVYDNDPFQRVESFRRAQRSAKAAPRGVWRLCR